MVTSLMVPVIIAISSLDVSQVSASPGPYTIIVRGSDTAANIDGDATPPWRLYGPDLPDKCPPIMATNTYGKGRIAVSGFSAVCRDTRWDSVYNPYPYLNVLLDATFKWMRPGPPENRDNVLWWGEGLETADYTDPEWSVYNAANRCTTLIKSLRETFGYDVDNTALNGRKDNITPSLLENYDILVIPQMELGPIVGTGGDPSLMPPEMLQAIENFVENKGGGLLIMDGYDSFGYNFCWVQDNILKALDMGIYCQSDTLTDEDAKSWYTQSYICDVDNSTDIGAAYKAATGENLIGLYISNTLAERYDNEVTVSVKPRFLTGFPGSENFICDVTTSSPGWRRNDITLSVENVWPASLDNTFFDNVGTDIRRTKLKVRIPSGAKLGDSDAINVVATLPGGENAKAKIVVTASMQIGPPLQDTYLTQYSTEAVNPLGGYIWMQVGSSPDNNKRSYLQFSENMIPSGLIPPDNLPIDNIRARLFAHCGSISTAGMPGKNVQCWSVDNDAWLENELKGWENRLTLGTLLDNTRVTNEGYWYSWDVTSYVISQWKSDNKATFCLKAENEDLTYPDNFVIYSFDTTNVALKDNWKTPYLVIGYDVSTWISSDLYDGRPGGTLTSTVSVQNMGSRADNFNLTKENIWEATLSYPPDRFKNVLPMEIRTATLTIKIPSGAAIGDNDNVRVTAISERSGENDVGWCLARAENRVSAWEDSTTSKILNLENSTSGLVNATGLSMTSYSIYVARQGTGTPPGTGAENGPERGWLKFDLRTIPSLTGVENVYLSLNCRGLVGGIKGGSSWVKCYGVDNDNWLENEINWRNKPSIGSLLDNRAALSIDERYTWDVTSFVQSQFGAGKDNIASFCLVDLGENIDPVHGASFNSKEDVKYMDLRPYLEILYASPARQVRASVKPVFQGGLVGDNLQYTITVKNTGTVADNYDLKVDNTQPWSMWLGDNLLLNVGPSENRTTTLGVLIPSVDICTVDNITITVISKNDSTVYDNIRCFAHRGKATFAMENLYKISIDPLLILREDADNLIAKFYKYDDTYQGERSVWDNAWPWRLIQKENVPHPFGGENAVEKVRLVLTGSGEIQTVASWTVTRGTLFKRYGAIKIEYVKPGAPGSALFREYGKVKTQYAKAP